MTGGQFSPTTPYGRRATTAVYGSVEHSFNISQLAVCAGAVFVARGTVYHTRQLDQMIEKALLKKGFSVVEVISQCQTHYGRLNKLGNRTLRVLFFLTVSFLIVQMIYKGVKSL
jgi:2-oxoglutarate ferredoxin oxidoreductase subunit beta